MKTILLAHGATTRAFLEHVAAAMVDGHHILVVDDTAPPTETLSEAMRTPPFNDSAIVNLPVKNSKVSAPPPWRVPQWKHSYPPPRRRKR